MQSRLHRYLGRCKSMLVHLWLTTPGWLLYLAAVEFLKSGDAAHPGRHGEVQAQGILKFAEAMSSHPTCVWPIAPARRGSASRGRAGATGAQFQPGHYRPVCCIPGYTFNDKRYTFLITIVEPEARERGPPFARPHRSAPRSRTTTGPPSHTVTPPRSIARTAPGRG